MNTSTPGLNGADLDALFNGTLKTTKSEDVYERCDECEVVTTRFVDFGSSYWLEFTPERDSVLERRLNMLREQHGRYHMRLCFECLDALMGPQGLMLRRPFVHQTHITKEVYVEHPRLFAVD
jgi:hypothetical protein